MATHSSIFAWRIPWTEEPDGLTVHGVAKSQTRLSDRTELMKKSVTSVMCVLFKPLSHVQMLCKSMDCSPPGSSVHGILQAKILEWVAMLSSRGSSQPRD